MAISRAQALKELLPGLNALFGLEYGKYEKYEIESAARTILEAEEIKADKEKMKYVSMCLKKKSEGMSKAISSLSELKAVAKKKSMEDSMKHQEPRRDDQQ